MMTRVPKMKLSKQCWERETAGPSGKLPCSLPSVNLPSSLCVLAASRWGLGCLHAHTHRHIHIYSLVYC